MIEYVVLIGSIGGFAGMSALITQRCKSIARKLNGSSHQANSEKN